MITLWLVGSFCLARWVMAPLGRALTRRVSSQSQRNSRVANTASRWALLAACVLVRPVCVARAAPTAASLPALGTTPSLSGTWSASALKEAWSFPAWPDACGARPDGGGASGGTAEVVEQGGELSFSGAGKAYKTSNCWDQSNGIRRVTHAQNARSWSNTCKTLSSDARQVNLQTSVTASDSRISLRETGHYVYRQGGATCEADVIRTRTYSRGVDAKANAADVRRASGAALLTPALAAPPDETTLAADPVAAKLAPKECPNPGAASELRFVNIPQWIEPGASTQVAAQAVDQDGCVTRATIQYLLEPVSTSATLAERTGLLRIAATAEQGQLSIVAKSGDLSKAITLPIVSKASRVALLHTPGDEPVQGGIASQPVADSIIGSSATRARDSATERKWWFAGLAGLIVVGLATLGLRLLRAGSRSGSERPGPRHSIPSAGKASTGTTDETPSSRGRRVPGGASITRGEIIVKDVGKTDPGRGRGTSAALFTHAAADSDPPITQSNRNPTPMGQTGKRESSCPRCGTRYVDGSLYCGVDGERLR